MAGARVFIHIRWKLFAVGKAYVTCKKKPPQKGLFDPKPYHTFPLYPDSSL